MKKVVVIGATSLIGRFLLPELLGQGWAVTAVSRRPDASLGAPNGVRWLRRDLTVSSLPIAEGDALVSLAPIWVTARLLGRAPAPPQRIIAFSSTSVVTKRSAANPKERAVARKLADGEQAIRRFAGERGIPWTIFRPTLVYGAGLDKNVSRIARFIERFRFFPLIGRADGRRMPVHAADLSTAVLRCLEMPETAGNIYALSGGETLSYRAMVERIFAGLNRRRRIVTVPVGVARAALALASRLPSHRDLTPEMADRSRLDLVFDHREAARDFWLCATAISSRPAGFARW